MTLSNPQTGHGAAQIATPHGRAAALWLLTFGTFVVGTGEFAIMGMLPEFAASLGLAPADAGHAITAYALGVVVGAPLITILGARLSRRELMLGLLLLFCFGNFLSIAMPTPHLIEVARFITGLPHGALFGISALVGAPFSTFAADHFGWRIAYLVIGLLGFVTFLGVLRYIPADAPNRSNSPLREVKALANT